MFNNVLVGVDGQQGGRDAIALAKQLVNRSGKLTLSYVHAGWGHTPSDSEPAMDRGERQHALELLTGERNHAGIEAQLRIAGARSVGRGLHVLAESAGADLLVVGSTRRALLGRVLLGDNTQAALNGAPYPVAIAPAGYSAETRPMQRIGVGYDGSSESEHALELARELASENDAKLSALHAVSLPVYAFTGGPVPADWIEGILNDAREQLAGLDGVESHAVYGGAAEELALFSGSVDLLVVGSRDYGPIGRLVYGSTSQQLARSARCPLLVLTRAARAAQALTLVEDGGEVARDQAVTQRLPQPPASQQSGRRSASADTAAARWGFAHPEEDTEHPPPLNVPEDQHIVPNRHSASAEAAALRWREQHEDDDEEK